MKVKKMLIGFTIVAVLFCTMAGAMMPVSATGEKKVEFSVSSASVQAGKTVIVEISAKGEGIAGIQGKLVYDKSALSVDKAEGTEELGDAMVTFHQEQDGKIADGQFVCASATGKDMNGTILKYTFNVSGNADGTYALTLEGLKVFDDKAKEISLGNLESGTLTVEGRAAPDITPIVFIIAGVLVAGLLVILVIGARKKSQRR